MCILFKKSYLQEALVVLFLLPSLSLSAINQYLKKSAFYLLLQILPPKYSSLKARERALSVFLCIHLFQICFCLMWGRWTSKAASKGTALVLVLLKTIKLNPRGGRRLGWISVFQWALLHVFGCFLHTPIKGNALSRHTEVSKSTSALHSYIYWHPSADLGKVSYMLQLCVKAALTTKKNSTQSFTGHPWNRTLTDNSEYPK